MESDKTDTLIKKFKRKRKKKKDHMPSIEEAGKAAKRGVREGLDAWMLEDSDSDLVQEYIKPGVAAIADTAADIVYPESASDIALAAIPGGKIGKAAARGVSRADAAGQVRKKISELDMKQIDKKLSEYVGGPIDKLLPSEKREILEKAIMKDRSVIDLIKKSRERIAEIKRKEDLMPKQRDIYPK